MKDKDKNIKTAKLLKESVRIVDELGDIDLDDLYLKKDVTEIIDLVERAKKLKRDNLWKLS